MAKQLRDEGIVIRCGFEVASFSSATTAQIKQTSLATAIEESLSFDAVLFAVGRKPRTQGFGLEALGLECDPSGKLLVNDFLQTKYPNIYACGDVCSPYPLTHVAAHQAWYCAVNALFSPFRKFRVDYRVIPRCTFTDPQCASVGLTETEARKRQLPFEVHSYDIGDLDRAIVDGQAHGMVKVLTRPKSDQIIGASIVASHAGESLIEFVSAMKHRYGLNDILGTIHPYPTYGEANKYVAGIWKKNHAPQAVLRWLRRYHRWRRGKLASSR